jgi:hypothetical protein
MKNYYRVNVEFVKDGCPFYAHKTEFVEYADAFEFAQNQVDELKNNGFRYFVNVVRINDVNRPSYCVTLFH